MFIPKYLKTLNQTTTSFLSKQKKRIYVIVILSLLLPVLLLTLFNLFFWERIYPGIKVAGVDVGSLAPQEAMEAVNSQVKMPEKITVTSNGQSFEIMLDTLDFSYDIPRSVEAAYNLDRTGNITYDLVSRIKSPFREKYLSLRFSLNQERLNESLSVIAGQISEEPVPPSVQYVGNNVLVNKGSPGKELDIQKLKEEISFKLAFLDNSPVNAIIQKQDPTISEDEANRLKERAEKILNKKLILEFEYTNFVYGQNELLSLLGPKGGYNESEINKLIEKISHDVERNPQNAVFIFEEGRVKEFAPAKDGVIIKKGNLNQALKDSLSYLESSEEKTKTLSVPVDRVAPEITNENVNNLGIKQLIGRGSSKFAGSITSRIHNISLASSKFNGVLVEPGETLSFNKILGDVSAYTGYKQAYIIKDGKTVLGDGGGVCQVSTTFFRAALNAGLPIIERRAHAYRVAYYEQGSSPGLDATVYDPTTDLKIKNDTPGHILIQTIVNTKNSSLVFEIYGTSDGRAAKITKPVVTSVVPPPEDLYTDDPSLPAGTVKQIDYKAWGAKVSFTYSVERNGEEIYNKTFISNYRPWQAKFLRGTGPVN